MRNEEVMGRFGAGTRNKEGPMVVNFAKRMNLAVVNIYFKKKDRHRVTNKEAKKHPITIDYVMCRKRNLKEMCDCKIMVNECAAKQRRMVVYKMALMLKKKKAENFSVSTVKNTSCPEPFREEVTRILGGEHGLFDVWDKAAEMLRKAAETMVGVTFGKRKEDRETW